VVSVRFLTLLMTTFAVAFAAGAPVAAQSTQAQGESSWVLQQGQGIHPSQVQGPSLKLQPQQLSGSTGCNAFTATLVTQPNNRVAIENVSLTRKLCGPQENDTEHAFVRALGDTHYLQQGPDTLTFLSRTHKPLLVWKKAAQSSESGERVLQVQRDDHQAERSRSAERVARHGSHRHRHAARHRRHPHHHRSVTARASPCPLHWFR